MGTHINQLLFSDLNKLKEKHRTGLVRYRLIKTSRVFTDNKKKSKGTCDGRIVVF